MKKEIDVFEYASEIIGAVKNGVLLTTKSGNKVNSMTISWGTLGIEWAKPIFTVFVRENRFTRQQLEENPEFTINIPYGEYDKKILGFCGTKSGRNVDKIKEINLTLENPEVISVPAIKELPLTLECKVVYKQMQDKNAIPEDIKKENYPQDVDSSAPLENKDYHVAYYGEIVKAYIVE
jgi:flavin reductase (DIM6/NTAB) family NADH-FMN oxidoreductase RutF